MDCLWKELKRYHRVLEEPVCYVLKYTSDRIIEDCECNPEDDSMLKNCLARYDCDFKKVKFTKLSPELKQIKSMKVKDMVDSVKKTYKPEDPPSQAAKQKSKSRVSTLDLLLDTMQYLVTTLTESGQGDAQSQSMRIDHAFMNIVMTSISPNFTDPPLSLPLGILRPLGTELRKPDKSSLTKLFAKEETEALACLGLSKHRA
ncbi:hypothetical protein DFJ73DRAFT_761400 [Zopfochytrium polystomum]|nr:hypothetical protein DFJ73DRAFT_761400 [Zopfochytrium polystomum]